MNVVQEVKGSSNQSAASTGSQHQTNNDQRVSLEIHLAAPERTPWLSIQSLRIEINLQPVGDKP